MIAQPHPGEVRAVRPRETGIERYYRFHSLIYDATRWSFLFGRAGIIEHVARLSEPSRILEVGCGTGTNLRALARRFPNAAITGLDLSSAMLNHAQRKTAPYASRVRLIQQEYAHPLNPAPAFDLVLFSYALSMFNPGWEIAMDSALKELAPEGLLAAVDFHDSASTAFREWMHLNHVRMEGHLRRRLVGVTHPVLDRVQKAYGGLWRYHFYVGRKKDNASPAAGAL